MKPCYSFSDVECDYRFVSGPHKCKGIEDRVGIKRCQLCGISKLYNMDEEDITGKWDLEEFRKNLKKKERMENEKKKPVLSKGVRYWKARNSVDEVIEALRKAIKDIEKKVNKEKVKWNIR